MGHISKDQVFLVNVFSCLGLEFEELSQFYRCRLVLSDVYLKRTSWDDEPLSKLGCYLYIFIE